ncbi:MAG: hypothetical protein ACR2KT_14750 [Methylocella sp.]|nr:MAG: hypothetical protein DLM68_11585 [Hyphomicrobiales bacterium]
MNRDGGSLIRDQSHGKSWHSAERSGSWNGLCAWQNGDGIAKKEKLRKSGDEILGNLGRLTIRNAMRRDKSSGKASKLLFLHGCMNATEKLARGFVKSRPA